MIRNFQSQPEVDKFRSSYHGKSFVASFGRDEFLQLDLLKLKKDNPRKFVVEMIIYYDIFAFFPDEEIIEKFKSVGFKKRTLQWFIPLEDILQKWEDILLKEEVGLFDGTCFEMIDIFINLKIKKEILTWAIKELPPLGLEQYVGFIKKVYRRQATERKHSEKYIHKKYEPLKELIVSFPAIRTVKN